VSFNNHSLQGEFLQYRLAAGLHQSPAQFRIGDKADNLVRQAVRISRRKGQPGFAVPQYFLGAAGRRAHDHQSRGHGLLRHPGQGSDGQERPVHQTPQDAGIWSLETERERPHAEGAPATRLRKNAS
jgi:hypothetical protein